jgi:nitrogen fixation protein NifU and related proteins
MPPEQLYQEIILDHYRDPHGQGLREPYHAQAYHVNPTCGDEVTVRVRLGGDREVADVSYEGQGCSISRAAASVLYDQVTARTVDEALVIHNEFAALMAGRGQFVPDEELLGDAVAFAGVARYPARVKCALLPWMAFKDALARSVDLVTGRGVPSGDTTTMVEVQHD